MPPAGTGFTYQGQLKYRGAPANGAFDFEFRLYDALGGGAQIDGVVTREDVSVTNGLFVVLLDFGANAFNGEARWLAIGVRPGTATAAYTLLSPRQALTAAPYALYADRLDGQHANQLPYWGLTGNAGTAGGANFIGTTDNASFTLRVNNMAALRIAPNATSPNLIGGYGGNLINPTVAGGTIGGGGASGALNLVTDDYGVVGGGMNNRAGDNSSSTSDATHATVGGGITNTASNQYATASGGRGTIGQSDAGALAGGDFELSGGFWPGASASVPPKYHIFLPVVLRNG